MDLNPLLIGERINVITTRMRKAMEHRDPGPIQEMAVKQVEKGANVLDINIGPAEDDPEVMSWLVETVQAAVEVPLSLDTTNPQAMELGLQAHKNDWGLPIINSCSGEEVRLNTFMGLAAKYPSNIIGLTLAKVGLPRDANERAAIAVDIMGKAMELGVPVENIILDPLAMTVKGNQDQAVNVIESIEMFQALNEPPMMSIVGLSNIVNMCPTCMKSLLTAVYWTMLREAGLTGAIVDQLEDEYMDVVRGKPLEEVFPAEHVAKTRRMFKGEIMFADSYLDL